VIPVGDVIPTRTRPAVTWGIAALTILVAIAVRVAAGDRGAGIAAAIGIQPDAFSWVRALGSLFLHLDWLSLVTNIAMLLIAGRTLEDRLGHDRFAALYVLGALAGAVTVSIASPAAFRTVIGAGAAVGSTAGAYLALFPRSRVLMWLPVVNEAVEIPAVVLIATWCLCQLIAAADAFAPAGTGGVAALWNVIGGLVMGAGLAHLLVRRERLRVDWWS
jgi:membrane associated rhomboid family serine protease